MVRKQPETRRYQDTDRERVLLILTKGMEEQAYAAQAHDQRQRNFANESLAKHYDENTGKFKHPEALWVAVTDNGAIVGVMQLMSEADEKWPRYAKANMLCIAELDAWPKGERAGSALLDRAKCEARRRGWNRIILSTVRNSEAHLGWYPSKGFIELELVDDNALLVPMMLEFRDG